MKRVTVRLGVVLVFGLGLAAALLWVTGSVGDGVLPVVVRAAERPRRAQAAGDVYCVTPEGGTYSGCTQVFTNVQAAVDAASGGETIKVAGGTYSDVHARPRQDTLTTGVVTQVVYVSKTVHIVGGYTTTNWDTSYPVTQPTTLDPGGKGRGIYVTGAPSANPGGAISLTIAGLRITGGDASGLGGGVSVTSDLGHGGGLYVISATLVVSDSTIISNTSRFGGGIFALWANIDIAASKVVSNQSGGDGGGLNLFYGDISVRGSSFLSNTADNCCAGLSAHESDGTFFNNRFSGNRVTTSWWGTGGGLYLLLGNAAVISNTFRDNAVPGAGGGFALTLSTAVISGNLVISNSARHGGGLSAGGEIITLTNNVILSNTAKDDGGGIALGGGVRLIDNVIAFNSAGSQGGGLYLQDAQAVIIGNAIVSNAAGGSLGGGVDVQSSKVSFSGNTVVSNTVGTPPGGTSVLGGGVLLWDSEGTFDGDTIAYNTSYNIGGAFYLYNSPATMTNMLIHDNYAAGTGSGVYVHNVHGEPLYMAHSTIARNSGGDGSGMYLSRAFVPVYSTVYMTNTILVSHTVGITVAAGSTATLEATLWGTDTWGNGMDWGGAGTVLTGTLAHNWWAAPGFVDPDAGDYHLRSDSAAIDKGVDAGVATDVDGDPRPMRGGPDLGADEATYVDLAVTPGVVAPGETITYTLVFTNVGVWAAEGVVITDLMPAAVTMTHVVSSGVPITDVGAASGAERVWAVADLAPGKGGAITITGVVSPSVCGVFSLTNQVVATADEDRDAGNNLAHVSSTVDGQCWMYLPLVAREE
jgi:uncharacterized repeat protein (TIGR01451 family)